jgi:leader peptidase (prepilin peptidase) / N-methyltransferase
VTLTLLTTPPMAEEAESPWWWKALADAPRAHTAAALAAGAVLVGLTFVTIHPAENAALYAVVQILLVAVAAIDLATRRVPNELIGALVVLALVPRALGDRGVVLESVVAGLVVFGIALLLAYAARGGLGMGDVKLAAALGFVLGKVVLPALLLGTAAGAAAGLAVIARRGRAGRHVTIAYGPYLALGGASAILLFGPPPLV